MGASMYDERAPEMVPITGNVMTARYQVTLTDESDPTIRPPERARINRFFDDKTARDNFLSEFEAEITRAGGKVIHNPKLDHFYFRVFDIYDAHGRRVKSVTVYRG